MLRSTLAAAATVLLLAGCTVTTSTSTGSLAVENLRYSSTAEENGVRTDATFKPGETVFVLFDVKGFKTDDKGQVHVQEDLVVKGPDGAELLNKKNILDFTGDPKGGTSLKLNNDITLPAGVPAGKYGVTINLRDVVSSGTHNLNSSFTVAGDAAAAPGGDPAAMPGGGDPAAAPAGDPAAMPGGTETPAAGMETPAMDTATPAADATEEPVATETPSM